jgi:peptide/nickel transport system substrate-binding protein
MKQMLLIIVYVAVIGCGNKHRTDTGVYRDTSIGDASYLNPLLASDSASGDINNLLFNGLVKYDKNLVLIGDLAESWVVLDNGLRIRFILRRNIRWHDGVPFTARDVEFTYRKLIDPLVKTPYSSDYQLVSNFAIINSYTIEITYKEPFAPALESWGMGMIPEHIFKEGDFNAHPANRKPIGTGPYIFKEWITDQKIVLDANPDYYEGRQGIDRYVYRIIPDQSVQFLELRNESIDSMSLTPDMYNAYNQFFDRYNKFRYPAFQYAYLGLNLNNALFKDKNVRHALEYAINKKEIIDGILQGLGKEASGPFPPASWAYNTAVHSYPYDPGTAATLLAKAGWIDTDGDAILDNQGRKFSFTLITNQGNKTRELCAQIIQAQLKKVGIDVAIRIIEWSTFIHSFVDSRTFDAVLLAWNLSRDPDCYSIWHSSQRTGSLYNFVSYANPAVDRLLVSGRREFDRDKRAIIYRQIHAIIADDKPYIFLYYPDSLPVVHKRVRGPEVAPAGLGWNFIHWRIARNTHETIEQ